MTSYQYFPGCSLKTSGAAYEESMLELFRVLGIQLDELEDWNCCGATSYMAIDEVSAFVLSARNLSIAGQKQADLLAPCSACYLVLRKTQDYTSHYPEIGEKVAKSLSSAGLPPLGAVKVRHPLEALYNDVGIDKIKSLVKRKWTGGRLACYYGCQIVRPYDEVDRPHDPTRMDELMQAVGVPTVPYSLKTKCCGGMLTSTIHDVGVRMNYVLLKEAVRSGADCIVTVCPLCQYNLDACQDEIRQETGEDIDIPIVYFTQVLGWALGGDVKKLGLKRCVAGRRRIKRWFVEKQEVEQYV
ncbi:MAG: CoB--CoM heterodisulfide reductase iron-sulfur subunit B family protein [bacterium]|jgi:heterodisulfide reductase subunit B